MITAKAIIVSMVFSIKLPNNLPESEQQREQETRCNLWREELRIPESESVHMGALFGDNLYRFGKRLTRPKSSIHFDFMFTKQASFILLQALKSCINTNPFQIKPAFNV
jgi:hypothetical protein